MTTNPTFTMYVGPMFGSKTSKLLFDIERFKLQKKNVIAFKPTIDDRYSVNSIVSHAGWSYPARTVKTSADIIGILAEEEVVPDVVAVDEAFMVPGIAETLIWLYSTGISIVVSTLDVGSHGKSFAEVEKMLAWATRVEKCAAVCTECGKDAFYTHKKHVSEEEIHIGGSELYEPRCFSHCAFINNRPNVSDE